MNEILVQGINTASPFIYGAVALSCVYMISKGTNKLDILKRIGYSTVVFVFAILLKVIL